MFETRVLLAAVMLRLPGTVCCYCHCCHGLPTTVRVVYGAGVVVVVCCSDTRAVLTLYSGSSSLCRLLSQATDGSAETASLRAELERERERNEELSTQKTSLMRKNESLQQDLKKVYVSPSCMARCGAWGARLVRGRMGSG